MSKVTPEELAAFADGELDGPRRAEVEAAISDDPALAEQLRAHLALKKRLASHFAPILEAPLPEELVAKLTPQDAQVVDLAAMRERRGPPRRWAWIVGPALAASLLLAFFLGRSDEPDHYAGAQLAAALDNQLVATQPADSPDKILLSFRDRQGAYCRAFAGAERSGIACRNAHGWKLQVIGESRSEKNAEYSVAGERASQILAKAQKMAAGPALDAGAERAARAKGWM